MAAITANQVKFGLVTNEDLLNIKRGYFFGLGTTGGAATVGAIVGIARVIFRALQGAEVGAEGGAVVGGPGGAVIGATAGAISGAVIGIFV